jgi:hypothetical protein
MVFDTAAEISGISNSRPEERFAKVYGFGVGCVCKRSGKWVDRLWVAEV